MWPDESSHSSNSAAAAPSRKEPRSSASAPAELRRAEAGYLRVWPRPEASEQDRLYRTDYYESDRPGHFDKMERELDFWDASWSIRRELFETTLGSGPRRLLDVGSSGGFLQQHFEKNGWTTQGIEPSRRAAKYARSRFGVSVFCGGVEDYPAGGQFDVVHSAKVLEHVMDPDLAVERMASWIRPGGLAYLELPNEFNGLQTAARDSLEKEAWWVVPRHHLNYFNYDSLSSLLAQHGLVEIDRLASFPMEMFLLMGRDYIGDSKVGAECHEMRMQFEKRLVASGRSDVLRELYRALGQASLGRTCAILAQKVK